LSISSWKLHDDSQTRAGAGAFEAEITTEPPARETAPGIRFVATGFCGRAGGFFDDGRRTSFAA
jgi:hypothetical protein